MAAAVLGFLGAAMLSSAASGAEQPLPFEGTWVRADRVCSATAPQTRTYTAHEVTFSNGHCALRKVVFGAGEWELFEDCRRSEHNGSITERIRILGPDAILIVDQVNRLKIPRGRRYARCAIAAAPQKPATDKPTPAGRWFPIAPPPLPKP